MRVCLGAAYHQICSSMVNTPCDATAQVRRGAAHIRRAAER